MNQELDQKVQKLLESRRNLEIELLNLHKYIQDDIEIKKRKAIVENYSKKKWFKAELAMSGNFENVPSLSYLKLPPHTAVVLAVPGEGHPTYFNQVYNPNLALWFPAIADPTPAVCNPLTLTDSSHVDVFEAVTSVALPKYVTFPYKSGGAI